MPKRKTYPIVGPDFVFDMLNEVDCPFDLLPGLERGIYRLNKQVLKYPPTASWDDEGFSSWVFGFEPKDGKFHITIDQPHYLKPGVKRHWVWDGKKFV